MTIAPCRALARFRHREKIAASRMARSPIMDATRVRLPYRSECGCSCHRPPYSLHIRSCCRPDPPARVKQRWLSRDTGEVVTRMWEQDIGGMPHLRVELRRADAPSDAEQQWAKAVVATHMHMMQALAATGSASVLIPSKPDARRGPENYWWDPIHGAVGASAYISPLPYRNACTCTCHTTGAMCSAPCCRPDPTTNHEGHDL